MSVSTTHRWPCQASSIRTCRASCADRLGRNPKLHGRKSASKTGSSTIFAAACTIRSRTARNRKRPSAHRSPASGCGTRQAGKGRYRFSRSSAARSSTSRGAPYSSTASRVVLSMPGAPLLPRTVTHPRHRTSLRKTLSHSAWNRASGIGLGRPVQRVCQARTGSRREPRPLPAGLATDGTHRAPPQQQHASTKQGPFPSPQVVLSGGSSGTTAASDAHPARHHFPGSPVIGRHAPAAQIRSLAGRGGPSSSRRHSRRVPRPLRRGIRHGCASRIYTASMAFALLRARHSLVPAIREDCLTTPQASLHVTDRTVAPPNRAFDAGLRPRPFPDQTASLLPGFLTATRTGLPPASGDELTDTKKHHGTRSRCHLPSCWAHGKRTGLVLVAG